MTKAGSARVGGTLRVFHWSHPEWSNLKRILGGDAVRDLIGDRGGEDPADGDGGLFTDLEKVFKEHFTSLRGTSLKKVAPLFGFHWRVENADGSVSLEPGQAAPPPRHNPRP